MGLRRIARIVSDAFTFASLHLHSTPSFFIRIYHLRRRLSASSRRCTPLPTLGHYRPSCATLHRTSHRIALRITLHLASHLTATHFNTPRTSHIYNSSHSTPASLFAPAGGEFNAFRRRASTCSKRLRKQGELQPHRGARLGKLLGKFTRFAHGKRFYPFSKVYVNIFSASDN